ncbi:hypothetical protein GCM10010300_74180 [Streptomyces olivaceoviridis]|nr:hypothetical protein GCM10010300_74180 [Streptomyces olivaceoviridis]
MTAVPAGWLYAVGDVDHRAPMTHQGKYQARIAGSVIGSRARGETLDKTRWGAHTTTADLVTIPQVVFTDPEVASVGRTTREAARAGRRVEGVDSPGVPDAKTAAGRASPARPAAVPRGGRLHRPVVFRLPRASAAAS